MPKLIILIGLPSSGKSFLADKISQLFDYIKISIDEIRKRLNIRLGDFSQHQLLFQITYNKIEQTLKYYNIVYDATNIDLNYRLKFLGSMYSKATLIGIFVNTPYATCLLRNSQKISSETVPMRLMQEMHALLLGQTLLQLSAQFDYFFEVFGNEKEVIKFVQNL